MAVGVDGQLDRRMAELVFHVGNALPVLQEQAGERMAEQVGVDLPEPGFLTARIDQPSTHIAFLEPPVHSIAKNRLFWVKFAALDREFCTAAFLGVPESVPKLKRHVDAPNAAALRENEAASCPLAAHFDESAMEIQIAPL
ncbi:MAG: hypothetical protein K8G79_05005 [bacterium]|uniref:Uncharacterized protein n=1 Tax=Candidatus Methylomirabilis tolerans TaxID=3123416 RepID=A0AAJ1EI70_9BACT|nr:hypothetical protein [Candidatus Methylomirabilis sp.]